MSLNKLFVIKPGDLVMCAVLMNPGEGDIFSVYIKSNNLLGWLVWWFAFLFLSFSPLLELY